MLDQELIHRADTQQYRHAAIAAIEKAAQSRALSILRYRECADIAELAAIEVPRGPMVHGVGLLPVAEGKQRDQPEAGTEPLIGSPAGEERAMPTVVLDNEQPHVEARGRQRQ